MAITRTAWIDDDGTGTTGTVINNAEKQLLYDQIDAALAGYLPVNPSGYLTRDLLWQPDATYDIGKSTGNRPRDVFVSRNLTVAVGGIFTVQGFGPHVFQGNAAGMNTVGIGNTTSGATSGSTLYVQGGGNGYDVRFNAYSTGFSSAGHRTADGGSLEAGPGGFAVIAGSSGGVRLTNGATAWAAVSDERLKTDLAPLTEANQKLASLRTMTGRYRTDAEDVRRVFLIGQDVHAVLPEAVSVDAEDYLMLRYTDVIPLMVAGHHEHDATIRALETRLAALEGRR